MTTALAFATFADAPVDVAVVEVGLGGAEDATNVLEAGVAVITPIGLDHTEWLGDTIAEIAGEKAGIIHAGATVISAAQPDEAMRPIAASAAPRSARRVAREGCEFGVLQRGRSPSAARCCRLQGLGGVYDEVFLPLHGAHQAQNAALRARRGRGVPRRGHRPGSSTPTSSGRASPASRSPGRLERVRSAPTVLLDAAHNPHGMAATVAGAGARSSPSGTLVAVVAVLADKDADGMLELLEPVVDADRGHPEHARRGRCRPDELADARRSRSSARTGSPSPTTCRTPSRRPSCSAEADFDGEQSGVGVLITGSVVTVADARKLLKR